MDCVVPIWLRLTSTVIVCIGTTRVVVSTIVALVGCSIVVSRLIPVIVVWNSSHRVRLIRVVVCRAGVRHWAVAWSCPSCTHEWLVTTLAAATRRDASVGELAVIRVLAIAKIEYSREEKEEEKGGGNDDAEEDPSAPTRPGAVATVLSAVGVVAVYHGCAGLR